MASKIDCWTDSDHAGCTKTRKSTSSSKVFFGKHLLKSSSTTQTVLALSSAESEFYAAVKTTSIGLGCISMMKDLGVDLKAEHASRHPILEVNMDASAGRSISLRRGAGRIRHIATPTLWVQRLVQSGLVKVNKVDGESNLADMGTKHLNHQSMVKLMSKCCYYFRSGTSELALKAETAGATEYFCIASDSE